ncbi:ABC transporter substrate-binding protein [uncultured Cohaesibacter sp.]|uniref:ABC transporter substrate-binding protein n=1 Tax=uncultured Cohaesibacter sp. TaxID=1002546 RepID=UPI0029C966DB|nr:ABC transporter substrate-binding protein [uncultured Cohaesibacter sp.]
MKRTTTLIATLVAATALSGVASAAELRMSWWGGNSRHEATQEALKICGEKYGHTINPEFTGWKGHLEKVTTQIAGGTEADIMQINWPWLPLFSINGTGFADLNEFKDVIDLSQWTDAQLDAVTVKGHLNGLPLSTTGRVFMFNKTTFEKAGLEIPKTWDELFAAAPVIKEKLGDDYYAYDVTDINPILTVSLYATQKTGKDLIDQETNRVAWSEELLAEAVAFYGKLVEDGVARSWKEWASEGNIKIYESPKWAEGKFGGSYEWDSTYFKYSDPLKEGNVLVPVPILKIDGAVTEGVYRKPSMMFSISKNSENKKAAAEILNCLLNEKEGIEALGATRGLPASKVAATMLTESGVIKKALADANKIIMDGTGPTVSPFNEHPRVREIFQDSLELYAYGEISAEDAASDIIDGVNDVLKKYD